VNISDIHITFTKPTSLSCDNKSAIHLAHNPTFHERTKHIEIDCHLIREKIERCLIKLFPISSTAQIADMLTKPLFKPAFETLLYPSLASSTCIVQLVGEYQIYKIRIIDCIRCILLPLCWVVCHFVRLFPICS
jgi:hypothetical protein